MQQKQQFCCTVCICYLLSVIWRGEERRGKRKRKGKGKRKGKKELATEGKEIELSCRKGLCYGTRI